jgi:hypothetical protein
MRGLYVNQFATRSPSNGSKCAVLPDDRRIVHRSDGGDLAVDKRRSQTRRREARALEGVPAGSALPIGEYPHAGDDLRHEPFELGAAPGARQALDPGPHIDGDVE